MTTTELCRAAASCPQETPVLVYADTAGAVERPFDDLREEVYLCGYFTLKSAAADGDTLVLLMGAQTDR